MKHFYKKLVNDEIADIKDNNNLTIYKHVKLNNTEKNILLAHNLKLEN